MYQLTYRSKSIGEMSIIALDKILEESQKNNSEKKVTGCLVYHAQSFVQILEGEKKDVKEIYGRIKLDYRHQAVALMWEGKVKERNFIDWSMAFYRPPIESNNKNSETSFVNNMLLLSEFSDLSTGSLLTFWATVKKFLNLK